MTFDGRLSSLVDNDSTAAILLAQDALDAGRPDIVAAAIERIDPGSRTARSWQLFGIALRELGASARALEAFQRAAYLDPDDSLIAAGHATAAYEAGQPSARLFHTARSLAPADPELLVSTVAALRADGHGDIAQQLLMRALTVNPGWIRGLALLAKLRWAAGQTTNFARGFREAQAARPLDLDICLAWQQTLAQASDWEGALAIIAAGRGTFGPLPAFDAAEAYIATETGDDDRAEHLFASIEQLDDPGVRVAHIRHCLRTRRIDEAEAIASRLIESPAAAMAWPYLSLIWRLSGNARAAWLERSEFIRTVDLPIDGEALRALAVRLRTLHKAQHEPLEQSLRGGTQTEGDLLRRTDPELVAVHAMLLKAVRDYASALGPHEVGHPLLGSPRDELRLAASWSVRLRSQGFHIHHTHPLGWISSVFYVALPDRLGPAPAGWLELGAPPADLRLGLPAQARVSPKPGRLVLFPSTMWHGTVPFDDGERLTIAFDVAVPRR